MKMKYLSSFLFLFILIGCEEKIEYPASESIDLFDIEVGKPFPIKPLFAGEHRGNLPVIMFSVPLPENSSIKAVNDFKVQISRDSGLISHVSFQRAYSSLESCKNEVDTLSSLVKSKFQVQNESSNYSTFEALSGDVEFDIYCSVAEGSPYHDLRFLMSSKKLRLKYEKQMKSLTSSS